MHGHVAHGRVAMIIHHRNIYSAAENTLLRCFAQWSLYCCHSRLWYYWPSYCIATGQQTRTASSVSCIQYFALVSGTSEYYCALAKSLTLKSKCTLEHALRRLSLVSGVVRHHWSRWLKCMLCMIAVCRSDDANLAVDMPKNHLYKWTKIEKRQKNGNVHGGQLQRCAPLIWTIHLNDVERTFFVDCRVHYSSLFITTNHHPSACVCVCHVRSRCFCSKMCLGRLCEEEKSHGNDARTLSFLVRRPMLYVVC